MAGDVDDQQPHGDELAQHRAPFAGREVLADAVGAERHLNVSGLVGFNELATKPESVRKKETLFPT
jgi:hypothetical protein